MNPNEIFGQKGTTDDGSFVSFEEVENMFRTPTQRQADYEPKPDPTQPMGDLGRLADPNGEAANDYQQLVEEEHPNVDHAHAMRTGERIASVVDTAIDFTLSNFVAHNNESYRADERDLQDIAECWGELAEEKGWSIGPEWTLVILYIMVYGPLVKQAFVDRKISELEARQKMLEDRMKAYEYRAPEVKITQMPDNNGTNPNTGTASASSPYSYKPNT